MRRSGTLGVALVAVLLFAACSEDPLPSDVEPSSAFPDETAPTGPTAATGPTGTSGTTAPTGLTFGIPTGTTGATGPGKLTSGRATVSVSGDLATKATMPNLFTGTFGPPPGAMVLVWNAGGTDASTLGLGGLSFIGTKPTAPTLSLTLTIQVGSDIASFVSTEGECRITIERASGGRLSGSFTCSDLSGSLGEVVDANGTFTAQG